MKLLTSLLALIAFSAFGANPDYKVFRGTGGIIVTTNPPVGTIVIDGSGIAGPTNGVSLSMATNIAEFYSTNTTGRPAPPISSVQFNSNGVMQGSAGFVYTNGIVAIGTATPNSSAKLQVEGLIIGNPIASSTAGSGGYLQDGLGAAVFRVSAGNNWHLDTYNAGYRNSITVNGIGTVSIDGHLFLNTDNTYDIGASGANRPRNLYLGNEGYAAGQFTAYSYQWGIGGPYASASGADSITLRDSALTSFNSLHLGGDTAAFPAIGRTNGDVIILGADGAFGATATNRLHVPGGIVLTNANVAPGKVWTAVGGLGGGTWSNAASGSFSVSGNSNQIPFLNVAGTGFLFGSHDKSAPGFGMVNRANGNIGALLIHVDENQDIGLVQIGPPNPAANIASFVPSLSITNRYSGDGQTTQEMVRVNYVDVDGGSSTESFIQTWRSWVSGVAPASTLVSYAAALRKDGQLMVGHGVYYPSNSLANTFPTAAQLGPGGHWVGNSNGTLVSFYSLDGTTIGIKVLAP